jgi:hypothetical protein
MGEATARQRAPLPTPRGGGDRTRWPDSNSKIIGAQQQSAARRCHCHHPSRTLLLQPTSPPGACAGWLVGRVLMGAWLVFLSFLTERHGTADSFLRVWVFAVVTGAHIVGLGVVTALPVSGRRSPVSEHSCSKKSPPCLLVVVSRGRDALRHCWRAELKLMEKRPSRVVRATRSSTPREGIL